MKFELWHGLESGGYEKQADDLIMLLTSEIKVISSKVDSEWIFKANITINSLEELKELSPLLDDDIVIYGPDSDIIMTVKTMKELGLG